MKLSDSQKKQIEKAVNDAEGKTSGEIVPMIVGSSDVYPASHYRLAIIMGLALAIGLYYSPLEIDDPVWFLWIQVPGIIIGYLLAFIPTVKRFFSTEREIAEEVRQKAVEAFFENNLHTTRDRTGILIMFSLLEQRAVILADSGINDKVEQSTWDSILDSSIKKIKEKDVTFGFVNAIEACGDILSNHFPRAHDDQDELSNKLIED